MAQPRCVEAFCCVLQGLPSSSVSCEVHRKGKSETAKPTLDVVKHRLQAEDGIQRGSLDGLRK